MQQFNNIGHVLEWSQIYELNGCELLNCIELYVEYKFEFIEK